MPNEVEMTYGSLFQEGWVRRSERERPELGGETEEVSVLHSGGRDRNNPGFVKDA